jgi:hypothetical protein
LLTVGLYKLLNGTSLLATKHFETGPSAFKI